MNAKGYLPSMASRRRCVAVLAALISSFAVAPLTVYAQSAWPNRTIRIVVPFGPGGASDILARLIAKELTDKLKQTVIVENKPGAGGTIGADQVAKS
jgi:tripartite-type tricarboxylate transporter receptor subunit TctC